MLIRRAEQVRELIQQVWSMNLVRGGTLTTTDDRSELEKLAEMPSLNT